MIKQPRKKNLTVTLLGFFKKNIYKFIACTIIFSSIGYFLNEHLISSNKRFKIIAKYSSEVSEIAFVNLTNQNDLLKKLDEIYLGKSDTQIIIDPTNSLFIYIKTVNLGLQEELDSLIDNLVANKIKNIINTNDTRIQIIDAFHKKSPALDLEMLSLYHQIKYLKEINQNDYNITYSSVEKIQLGSKHEIISLFFLLGVFVAFTWSILKN
jgi:hypothetical protein